MKRLIVNLVALIIALLGNGKSYAEQFKYKWINSSIVEDAIERPKAQSSDKNLVITLEGNPTDGTGCAYIFYENPRTNKFDLKVEVEGESKNSFTIRPEALKGLTTFKFQFYKNPNSAIGNVFEIPIDPKKLDLGSQDQNIKTKEYWLRYCMSQPNFNDPYDDKNNKVYLYFDENGKLLNNLPVNVDQNDKYYLSIISPKEMANRYSLKTVEGIYEPVDLLIRPITKPNLGDKTVSQSAEDMEQIEYAIKLIIAGPFTSDYFRFQITYDDTNANGQAKKMHSEVYSMKVNKLFHVGVGVSLINTNLSNPTFKTISNATDTTIQAFNSGSRTLVTLNVIWYWSVLQQNRKGSIITSGRDVLKDEPTFSLSRIYPTVGVSLDNLFRENLFGGFVYEFARGGSIIIGVHYGKVNELAYKDFQLGNSTFHGNDSDIKIDQVYKAAGFLGVNLDTRIFNILLGANK